MNRRQFIAASVVAGSAAVAGCSGADGDSEASDNGSDSESGSFPSHELPGYSSWIPQESRNEESGVFFTHLNWEAFDEFEENDSVEDDEDTEEIIEEVPILGLALYGAILTPLAMFGMMFYPFAGDVFPEDGEEVEGIETTSMTWTEDVILFHGEYDPEVFAAQYAEEFDEVDERDEFTLYVGVEGFSEGMAYAISEETLVVGLQPGSEDDYQPEDVVSDALERNLDEVNRVIDTDDGNWLFETTGEAPMVFGVWDTNDFTGSLDPEEEVDVEQDTEAEEDAELDVDPDIETNPVFDNVESLINNLAFSAEDGEMTDLEARFSAIYPEDEVPSEEEVQEHLIGETDVPHEIIIDGNRVHASATFEETPS
jgi:hypothetical protein